MHPTQATREMALAEEKNVVIQDRSLKIQRFRLDHYDLVFRIKLTLAVY